MKPGFERSVTVIGGGLAGLCAARAIRLSSGGRVAVTLVESSTRFGGWLHSERVGGQLYERGCRGIRPSGESGARVLSLIESLGLTELATASSPSAAVRYIQYKDQLEAVPRSLVEALRSPLTRGAPLWALKDLFAAPAAREESVAAFVERHFGAHAARVLLDAALGGIYAGDIDQLSARSVLGAVHAAEQKGQWGSYASVLLGLLRSSRQQQQQQQQQQPPPSPFVRELSQASSVSFVDGLSTLVLALQRSLQQDPGVELLLGSRATDLREDASVRVLSQGSSSGASSSRVVQADCVVLALPAPALSALLRTHSALAEAAGAAGEVPMASVGVVGLGWTHRPGAPGASPHPALPHAGFGYLVPQLSRPPAWRSAGGAGTPPLLGMTWDSEVFPGQEEGWAGRVRSGRVRGLLAPASAAETRVTVMMGGARHSSGEYEEGAMVAAALAAARHSSVRVGVGAPPTVQFATVARAAIPQYTVGHAERLRRVEAGLGRVLGAGRAELVGNSWRGVGAADTAAGALAAGTRLGLGLLKCRPGPIPSGADL